MDDVITDESSWTDILSKTKLFGKEVDSSRYIKIAPDDPKYSGYTQASHVLVYAKTDTTFLETFERKAIVLMQLRFDGYMGFPGGLVDRGETPIEAVNREMCEEMGWKPKFGLMQMRFDGKLGFPGGLVDSGEDPVTAVNREMKEEMGWDEKFGAVEAGNHQFTHYSLDSRLVLHFYSLEVQEKDILEIERNALGASDHGGEVLGVVRAPLYTMGDGFGGFSSFLRNAFVGNAKAQFIETIVNLGILDREFVIRSLVAGPLLV